MSFNVNNIDEQVRIEGVIKSVSGNKSRKKEKDTLKWKKDWLKKERYVSEHLATMSWCNHHPGKSLFLNLTV